MTPHAAAGPEVEWPAMAGEQLAVRTHMDAVSHIIGLAQLTVRLDKRCLLGASTRMDVAAHGDLEAPFHVLLADTCRLQVGSRLIELEPGTWW